MPDIERRGYGRKGGTSATAGRKAETIAGQGHSKRVFYGQRVLVVYEGGGREPLVVAATDPHEVRTKFAPPAGEGRTWRWFWCETVNGQPFTPPEA